MSQICWILYGALAILLSLFYGLHAVTMWPLDDQMKESRKDRPWRHWRATFDHPLLAHQAWFNFVGSLIGWIMGGFLVLRISSIGRDRIGLVEFGLFLVATLGISGYLPRTIHGIAGSFDALGGKLREKL